ncbi:ion transporter [Elongatibacter sediminis]|uniref:Ion transporter n=1 Tax=Elongatibacter sediminis TaxID=3119006 RepID=A0AAW9RBS6_9GAMM
MNRIRHRIAELLEAGRDDDGWSLVVDIGLVILIVVNVAAVMLATVPDLPEPWNARLWRLELFSVAIFTVEYLARLWTCIDVSHYQGMSALRARIRWMFSPLGLIDLLAIAPFYVFLFLPISTHSTLLLRIFRGLRLLRIFKLTRYSPALNVLRSVLIQEARTLILVAFLLLVILVFASWGIYLLERDVQPEAFGSIPRAMWWAVVSLTTVGYGDVVPVTGFGRAFAGLIALIGIGMAALPAGILASGFASEMRRREQAYSRALGRMLSDGSLTPDEARELERLREKLNLSEEEAHGLLMDANREWIRQLKCPHCGNALIDAPPE